jgi:hypothetical protein
MFITNCAGRITFVVRYRLPTSSNARMSNLKLH